MKNLLFLTSAALLYALANGFVAIALPQVALNYGMSSAQLGLLGAAGPLGYGIGCIVLGQLFFRLSGKHALLGGVVVSTVAIAGMAVFTTIWPLALATFIYGIAQGSVWPFLSAWMLDFQSASISRTRILRCYNIGWTCGAGLGMYLAGILCDYHFVIAAIYVGAAFNGLTCIGGLLAAPPHSHVESSDDAKHAVKGSAPDRIGFAIFLAAALANIGALATRAMIGYNYPELNRALHFDAQRMGIIGAASLGGQTVAFAFGAIYESRLGSRRMYAAMSIVLVASSLCFAMSESLPFGVVVAVSMALGGVLAMAFQAALLAATEWFTNRRNGTTVHEGLVGFAQALTWIAGWVAQNAKNSGVQPIVALRLPFLLLPIVLGAFLIVQLLCVSRSGSRRILLPALSPARATADAALVSRAQ